MTAVPPAAALTARRRRTPLSRGEQMLLVVLILAALHQVDHVLRADNSGWPFTADVTPFTISFIIYPLMALDFGYLRNRPWSRVALVAVLFVALQVVHLVYEPPGAQYGTWANGVSDVPHALGRPNLLGVAAPALGVASVMVSTLLSAAVLVALALLIREARANPNRLGTGPATHRDGLSRRSPKTAVRWTHGPVEVAQGHAHTPAQAEGTIQQAEQELLHGSGRNAGMPTAVVPYDSAWPQRYESAATELFGAVGERFLRLEHIGSTAVPGLAAKPTVDMMASVPRLEDGLAARAALAELGYELVETGTPNRLFFQRRTSTGTPSHHLHLVTEASWATRNERLLRDHLRSHSEDARRYGELKERLARDLGPGEAYTRAKTALIQELVDAARDGQGLPRVPVWEE